jgi:transcriptional regulator with XRE-family HTH domain
MELTFGEKIKEARKVQRLTQKQLADAIGAKHNSISDWENDKNKPDPDTIELLCGVLKITPNYLLKTSEDDFSPKEKLIIKKYRDLDQHGKKMVDFTLNEEWERSREIMKEGEYKNKITEFSKELIPDAAHADESLTEVTDEMIQKEDDIMDDENF